MKTITRRSFMGAAGILGAALAGCSNGTPATDAPAGSTASTADIVLRGGNVITCVDENDRAEAVAISGNTIVAVGSNDEMDALIGDDTEVIELDGMTVTPGFVDGHIHPAESYLTANTECSFYGLEPSLDAYKQAFADFVAANPDFPVYLGSSMDLGVFPESFPTNDWVNEICKDKPVCIHDVSKHGALLNQYAIDLCGLTKDTPNPPSGTIYHDAAGELTGYFSDCGAILDAIPSMEYTDEDWAAAWKSFVEECSSYGLTTLDSGGDKTPRNVLHDMEVAGELNVRVNTAFFHNDLSDEGVQATIDILNSDKEKYASDFLRFNQIKFKVDGVPEGKSAFLLEPYAPEAGEAADYVGTASCTQEELDNLCIKANAAGYSLQTHCMGDASVQMANNAHEASVKANGKDACIASRNKITHANLMREEEYTRMADMNVTAAMQPLWFYFDPFFSPLEAQMFGPERFAREYHIKDMIDAGIRITGSNDYPVTLDFNPLHGIEAGIKQCSPYEGEDDQPETYTRNADQGVSAWEMLKMYTVNGAYAAFMEDMIGTIEVGKKADLAVLDQDILSVDYKLISDTKVMKTISDGRIVFEAANAE